jgi:catechol 2,3-dioxygenase-like lactoylglutathione lyase family enzyme
VPLSGAVTWKDPLALDHLDHIVLRVRDLQKSLTFYAMLGAHGQREVAGGTVMRVASNPNQSVIFQQRSDGQPPDVRAIDHTNLTIRTSSFDEVGAYLRENAAENSVGHRTVSQGRPST